MTVKFKIKKEILATFQNNDFACVIDLTNLNTILNRDNPFFEKWIKDGYHAEMKFLEKNFNVRTDPSLILENAKTALIFLFPYAHGHRVRKNRNPNSSEQQSSEDNIQVPEQNSLISKKLISKYTYSKDYHKIIKKNLLRYAETLQTKLNISFDYRPVVDSIPFFERAHARESGLGFIGKNTLLIRPGLGSFFFIGTLLTDLDISLLGETDTKNNPILSLNCGDCTRCIDSCPTSAIENNFTLNANNCLSYLTIEHRDIVEKKFLPHFKKTIYGCDICQDVCPYNFVTQDVSMLVEFKKIHNPLLTLTAEEIAVMTEMQYQKWFGGTAMTRARYEGLVRNSLYYLHANNSPHLQSILQSLKYSSYPLIQKTVEQLFSESVYESNTKRTSSC